MSGAKFVVRDGLRLRQLDVASGRVEGWGVARFVYVRRGRLQPAPRAAVLRGLRELAAGRPGAVRDGPRLQQPPGTRARPKTVAETSVRHEEPGAAPAAQAQAKRAYTKYSAEEDECIVRWVAGRVNGNQMWQELQLVHERYTGTARSWQSLRNRYLRYLLPSLGATSLSAEDAARLRAGAASDSGEETISRAPTPPRGRRPRSRRPEFKPRRGTRRSSRLANRRRSSPPSLSDDSSSESDSAGGRGRVTRQQAGSTSRHPADGSRASTRRTTARPIRKDA